MENIETLYRQGNSIYKIAKQLNLTYHAVQTYIKNNNLTTWKENRTNLVLNLQQQNKTPNEIAKETGFNRHFVINVFKTHNLPLQGSGGQNKIINHNPFLPLTNNAYYWLGFIIADGCISNNSIRVTQANKDKEHLYKYKQFLNADVSIHKNKNASGNDNYCVYFGNKKVVQFLNDLGITSKKSLVIELKFPLNPSVLRGIFDGDGNVRIKDNNLYYKITSGSALLITQIQEYLANLNIKTSIVIKYTKTTGNPCYDLCVSAKNSIDFFKLLYQDDGDYLERKYNIAKMWLYPERDIEKLG